jgi:Mitochondrial carrier protein
MPGADNSHGLGDGPGKNNGGIFSPAILESIAGLAAGGATALLMSPLDNVRTRLQLQSTLNLPAHMKAKGIVGTMGLIAKHEGPIGFFRGLSSAGLGISIFWSLWSVSS